jgi:hypothetical protein
MTLRVPLSVRVVNDKSDRHITRDLRSLRFRSAAPGGFASATFSLDRPIRFQPEDVDYFARVYIYDTRSARVVWEGRLEDPGRGVSNDGQVWELAAIGPSGHVEDRAIPLIYVDRDVTSMERVNNVTPGGRNSLGDSPGSSSAAGDDQDIILQFPQGLAVQSATPSRIAVRYQHIAWAGLRLARCDYTWDAGVTDTNHSIQAVTRDDGNLLTGENARSQTLSTAGAGSSPIVVTTDFPATRTTVELRQIRTAGGASTIPSDNYWVSISGFYVQMQRYNNSGTILTNGATDYPNYWVYAHYVVKDLLGRLLTMYDGANATVVNTNYAIDQLAYFDGVTPGQVLDDLMLIEPAYYWAAWESDVTTGKYRFEWTVWPTTVRYEATADDGFDSPGSAEGLYNSVRIRYKAPNGHIRSRRRTSTVDVLTAAGITREAFIDLSDTVGSAANADQVGDQFLNEHRYPPNAGTLTITQPTMDLVLGWKIQPWEIRPGNLIRVRGVNPHIDPLNATDRDGSTVFRVVSVEYDTATASATLELDSYSVTTAAAIARARRRFTVPTRRR